MCKESSSIYRRIRIYSLVLGALLLSLAPAASAGLKTLNIVPCAGATTSPSPAFGGASFGSVGPYEVICGTFTGAVDPANPHNAVIVDIQNAPRDADGLVEYTVNFQIIRPVNLAAGSGRIMYDLPNRGGAGALSTLDTIPGMSAASNNSTASTITTAASAGTGFLMNMGWTIVEVGWDTTVPTTSSTSFGVNFPVAVNPDGSPITGPATEELDVDFTATPSTFPLTFPPATLNQALASLTVRENYEDSPIPVPACGPGVTVVCWVYTTSSASTSAPGKTPLNPAGTAVGLMLGASAINFGAAGTYSPTALYEFTYVATNPVPAGLGFAAIRDLATFLRDATADANGVPNPLAGSVKYIYTICSSQPCRTTHDYILWGFNEPENASDSHGGWGSKQPWNPSWHPERVLDGMLNYIGGGTGIYMNYRFSQPTRTQRQHIARWDPEFQFPFADLSIFDPVTGQFGGRNTRCDATDTCPNVFETNSENEYYSKGGSMLTTDGQGHDLDLDRTPSVRYYQLSSFQHGTGSPTSKGICQQFNDPLNSAAAERALLVALDAWTSNGVEPPRNHVATIHDGTLVPAMPEGGQGFPNIPGVSTNNISHTGDLWNFGPNAVVSSEPPQVLYGEGITTVQPPILLGTPYKIFVPATDADGNDLAGIRMPEVSVPTATFAGWNLRAAVPGQPVPIIDGCDAAGQYLPFAITGTPVPGASDPRPSLQQRYSPASYVSMITQAANHLESEGLLLPADAALYIANANKAALPSSGALPPVPITAAFIPPSTTVTIGPEAMEGDLHLKPKTKLRPGTTIRVGFDFSMPESHPAAGVYFIGAQVTFDWTCDHGSASGTLVVPLLNFGYSDPQNSPGWYPSGDRDSWLVYQGSIAVPDVCSGGLVHFQHGGTFSSGIVSTDATDKVDVRWHYSADGSPGNWSHSQSVTP